MRLSPKLETILENYLIPSQPDTPFEPMLLALLVKISQIACFNRVKIVNERLDYNMFPNIYAFNFMGSGAGKDKAKHDVELITNNIKKQQYLLSDIYHTIEKHKNNNDEDKKKKQKEEPRYLRFNISNDSTIQALLSSRNVLDKAKFGSIHFSSGEFLDVIQLKNENTSQIFTALCELFDHGFYIPPNIKSENFRESSPYVPQTLFCHSSIEGLKDNDHANAKVKQFFDKGFARRSIVSYPQKKIIVERDATEREFYMLQRIKGQDEATKLFDEFNKHIAFYDVNELMYKIGTLDFNSLMDIQKILQTNIFNNVCYKIITVEESLIDIIALYKQHCRIIGQEEKIKSLENEVSHREWRAIKLAGCIAYFEHPEFPVITKNDWEVSVEIIEYFSEHFRKFFTENIDVSDMVEQLFDYIKEHPGKSKSYIQRNSGIFKRKDHANIKLFNDVLTQTTEYAQENDYILSQKSKKGGVLLSLDSLFTDFIDHEVTFSQGKTNEANDPLMFPMKCKFSELTNYVCTPLTYSASTFKNNYRKAENSLIDHTMLIYDIDNDEKELKTLKDKTGINFTKTSIEKMRIKLKDYSYILVTSRNHFKSKDNKGIEERYRVILPIEKIEDFDIPKYKKLYEKVAIFFEIPYDPACSDPSRFFYGHDGEVHKNLSGKMIDWKKIDLIDQEIPKQKFGNYEKSKIIKGELSKNQVFQNTDRKKDYNYYDVLNIDIGKTIPVNCPFHDDKNPSAFLSRNDKSGNPQFHCTGCNKHTFFIS